MSTSSEANTLQSIPCIHYLVQFQEGQAEEVRASIDSSSKVNVMTLAFAAKLGLSIHSIGIGIQKINSSALTTYGMAIAGFSI